MRVRPEPTGSPLLMYMNQSKILELRSWYSKHFSTSPLLYAYPPIFYAASAQYLALHLVSISRRQLVMRRPLPILGTIVATKYRDGIYKQIISQRGRYIPERLQRTYQSIHERFSNFIWRGYEYPVISGYLETVKSNIESINKAICLGFQVWYSLLPCIMLRYHNYNEILNPEVVAYIKNSIRDWSSSRINTFSDMLDIIHTWISQTEWARPQSSGAGASWASAEPNYKFDPLGIREEIHKGVLRKLVLSCLTVCLLSSVAYTGTELANNFYLLFNSDA